MTMLEKVKGQIEQQIEEVIELLDSHHSYNLNQDDGTSSNNEEPNELQ